MAAKANNRQNLILGIIFVLLGVILAVTMTMKLIETSGTPEQFSSLTGDNIKTDILVEGDIEYNFGNYETLYNQKSNGYKETLGQYFLIQLSDGQLIGFYTSEAETIAALNRQEDVYYDYMTGKSDIQPEKLHFKGVVQKMDFEDSKIFSNYIGEAFNLRSDEVGDTSICVYIENYDNSEAVPIMLVGGVLLAIVGLVFVIRFFVCRRVG